MSFLLKKIIKSQRKTKMIIEPYGKTEYETLQKIKSFLSAYGLYVLVGLVMFAGGVFYGRYNVVIVTETEWDSLTKAQAQIIQFQADAELQTNLKGME